MVRAIVRAAGATVIEQADAIGVGAIAMDEKDAPTLARVLRHAREACGLTLAEVGAKPGIVNGEYLGQLETGEIAYTSFGMLMVLARIYDIDAQMLFDLNRGTQKVEMMVRERVSERLNDLSQDDLAWLPSQVIRELSQERRRSLLQFIEFLYYSQQRADEDDEDDEDGE